MNGDHPNYGIVGISPNIEKSLGDLRRLAHSDSSGKSSVNAGANSSLLLQQCPACLVRLTWIAFEMVGTIYQPLRSGRI